MSDERKTAGLGSTGDRSTGNRSTGDGSTGYGSTGNRSTGYGSTGHGSTGDRSTGDRSTGDRSTGHGSTGDRSTGNRSTGDWSTGDWSTGHGSTGNWSTGNWSTGHFATEEPKPTFFDKPFSGTWAEADALIPYVELPIGVEWVYASHMTDAEKAAAPAYQTTGGFLRPLCKTVQEAFPLAWAKMDHATKDRFLNLPNFDAEKFLKCTGVDVRLEAGKAASQPAPQDEIVLNGVRYRRVDE